MIMAGPQAQTRTTGEIMTPGYPSYRNKEEEIKQKDGRGNQGRLPEERPYKPTWNNFMQGGLLERTDETCKHVSEFRV